MENCMDLSIIFISIECFIYGKFIEVVSYRTDQNSVMTFLALSSAGPVFYLIHIHQEQELLAWR